MKCYVVDSFADQIFTGNPAAVCVRQDWLSDEMMQNIAMENNLSETAFAVKKEKGYGLRWFTPAGEIDLCGHATLAAGFVIMNFIEPEIDSVRFHTMSGELIVVKKDSLYEMDFPVYKLEKVEVTEKMTEVLGVKPIEAWLGRDLVCVLDSAEAVNGVKIDAKGALELEGAMVHITAKGYGFDCVSRSFGPKLGVEEDPVCGSGHCHIAPLWAKKLDKNSIKAYQASKRGGTLYCEVKGDRMQLSGSALLYSVNELQIKSRR